MKIVDVDNTQGDLKLLALAVKALIETHPDKEAFHAAFKALIDEPSKTLYAASGVKPYTGQLLQDILSS